MVKVAQHISQLLYCHDCVIVPSFGGFVTNYKPAKINPEKGIATPPSKSISFNRFLLHNDGLLINEISKQEDVSYKEASDIVKQYVDTCHEALQKNNRLEMNKIGVFYYANNKLQFKADDTNYEVKSYGLPEFTFDIKPIEDTLVEDAKPLARKEEPKKENRSTTNVKEERKQKRTLPKYVITTLAIVILFYTAWIPLKTDVLKSGNFELSDLNPFRFDKCPSIYSSAVKKIVFDSYDATEDSIENAIDIEDRTLVVVDDFPPKEIAVESTYVDTSTPKSSSKRFHVIAGCFKEYSNATALVDLFKKRGFEAEIIDQYHGLYRVSVNGFAKKEDAVNLYDSLTTEGISVWVLKK